jgi:hypothetical protein
MDSGQALGQAAANGWITYLAASKPGHPRASGKGGAVQGK